MGSYCKKCGSALSSGAKFCRQCGLQTFSVCAYCGAVTAAGLARCSACGAPLKGKSSPAVAVETAPVRHTPTYIQPQPAVPTPQPQRRQKKSAAVPLLSVIAALLAAAVLFVYVLNPLLAARTANTAQASGKHVLAGLTGAVTKKAVATVQAPAVQLHDLTIDVGTDNLQYGAREITVTAYNEHTDEQTGYLCNTYDIDVGGKEGELLYPVKITLPVGAEGDCLTHYEEEYGLWVPLESETSGNHLTASLTSFSPVRLEKRGVEQIIENTCYYIDDANALNAKLRVCSNYRSFLRITPEQAYTIVEDFNTNGNINTSFSVGSGGAADFAWEVAGGTETAKANTLYTVGGAIADLGNTFLGGSEVVSKKLAAVGLLVAAAQLWEDVRAEGFQSERTATNLMKNLCTNIGSAATLLNVGTTALSIGMLSVIGTGMVLDAAGTAANNLKENTMSDIYNNYLNDPTLGGFSDDLSWDNKWFLVFENAYYTAWQNGKRGQERVSVARQYLEEEIDAEAERICNELLTEGTDYISIAVGEAEKYNYYPPIGSSKEKLMQELRAELKAKFKARFYERLNAYVPNWMGDFLRNQLYTEIYANLSQIVEPFNKYQSILVQEVPPGSTAPLYSGYTLRFVALNNGNASLLQTPYHDLWCCTAPDTDNDWAQELEFTYLGYCLAGSPNALALFPPDANADDLRQAERIVPFTLSGDKTVVDLSVKDNEFAGIYESDIDFDYDVSTVQGIEGMNLGTPESRLKFVIDKENNVDVFFDASVSYTYSLYGAAMSVSSVSHGELLKQQLVYDGVGDWGPEYSLQISIPVNAQTSVAYGGEAYGGANNYSDTTQYSVQVNVRVLWIAENDNAVAVIRGTVYSDSGGQTVSSAEFTIRKTQ